MNSVHIISVNQYISLLSSHDNRAQSVDCGLCEYNIYYLKIHKHAHYTNPDHPKHENCNFKFKSEKKLNDQMCLIYVPNLFLNNSYLENCIIFHGCSRIFSKKLCNRNCIPAPKQF